MLEEKINLRREVRSRLAQLDGLEHEILSGQIAGALFEMDVWKSAGTIGITISIYPEIDTKKIIERAWQEGKKVAVPKCIPDTKSMVFKEISSFSQLETVYFGLQEPVESTRAVQPSDINLLIVPGLAFTKTGNRLGVGGGYYDRFLIGYKGLSISLAFQFQVRGQLPAETHDIPVKMLITPSGKIDCHAD
jgi:5-formyltetrahydrofolate cyclo-ligase